MVHLSRKYSIARAGSFATFRDASYPCSRDGIASLPGGRCWPQHHSTAGVEVAPIALQLFQPDRYVRGQTLFPTQNVIPCDQLRDEVHLSVLVACADSHSGWVFTAGLCIQFANERGRVITPHVLIVEKSPHGD